MDRYDIRLKLLIELKSQTEKTTGYLQSRKLVPERILYLENSEANKMGTELDPVACCEMNELIRLEKIDGMIISVEPKAHKMYAEWALKNNINILMDKPITAPLHPSSDRLAAQQIFDDYAYLEHLLEQSTSKYYVMCQRRNHEGYTFLHNYLNSFVAEFGVPISSMEVYHADGVWNLPHEFQKENHPYKYGYGKLMHSGYHFVDLFSWIAQINFQIERARPETASLYTTKFTPNDLFHQLDEITCEKLFHRPEISDFYKTYKQETYESYGELDVQTLLQLKHGPRVVMTGSINLQQNSLSGRGWFDLPEDTYKGNGRTRHERLNIQVSHFLNIQVHSYQSVEKNAEGIEPGDVGSEDHFDISIFRNTKMVGGKSFEKFSFGKEMKELNKENASYLGHNEKARETTLLNFVEEKEDTSEFRHHKFTNQLLSGIYSSMAEGVITGNPQVAMAI